MTLDFKHIPVLLEETVELLALPTDRECRLIDGTLGGGGHSGELLRRYPRLEVLGIDRDKMALEAAAEKCAFAADRLILVRGDFADMAKIAADCGWGEADGILLEDRKSVV